MMLPSAMSGTNNTPVPTRRCIADSSRCFFKVFFSFRRNSKFEVVNRQYISQHNILTVILSDFLHINWSGQKFFSLIFQTHKSHATSFDIKNARFDSTFSLPLQWIAVTVTTDWSNGTEYSTTEIRT